MAAVAKKNRPSDASRVLRVGNETFERLGRLKLRYADKNGMRKITYDKMLIEALNVATALLEGREFYAVGSMLFEDIAEARGEAVRVAVKQKQRVQMPRVLIELGKDPGP